MKITTKINTNGITFLVFPLLQLLKIIYSNNPTRAREHPDILWSSKFCAIQKTLSSLSLSHTHIHILALKKSLKSPVVGLSPRPWPPAAGRTFSEKNAPTAKAPESPDARIRHRERERERRAVGWNLRIFWHSEQRAPGAAEKNAAAARRRRCSREPLEGFSLPLSCAAGKYSPRRETIYERPRKMEL